MGNVIKNSKDVYEVASKLFKCRLKRIDEPHGNGYMGIQMVVGWKPNPAYDVSADPNTPGISPAEKRVLIQRSKPRVPDVRIFWLRPGISSEELIKEFLSGIQKTLDRGAAIIEKSPKIEKKTDENEDLEKMANDLEADTGEKFNESGFEDDYQAHGNVQEKELDFEESGFDDEDDDEELGVEDSGEEDGKEITKEDNILEFLEVMNKNIETLAGDLNKTNDSIDKLERRIDQVEDNKKPKGKKK